MRKSKIKRKALDHPGETNGSRLAAKIRKMAGKLTADQEADYLRQGMAKIYGECGKPTRSTTPICMLANSKSTAPGCSNSSRPDH